MTQALLSVTGLSVNYGHIEAVRDIDLSLRAGAVGPHQRGDLALCQAQVYALHRLDVAVVDREAGDGEQGVAHAEAPVSTVASSSSRPR